MAVRWGRAKGGLNQQEAAGPEDAPRASPSAMLEVRDLTVDYLTPRGVARAVDRVSFTIAPGEILGLAGESGCGKSTAAHAIMRLILPPGQISGGEIRFRGVDVRAMSERRLRDFRWREVSIVFQSAMNALNPVLNIGAQLVDAIRDHWHAMAAPAREARYAGWRDAVARARFATTSGPPAA